MSVWAGDKKSQKWGGGLTFVPDPNGDWKVEEFERADLKTK